MSDEISLIIQIFSSAALQITRKISELNPTDAVMDEPQKLKFEKFQQPNSFDDPIFDGTGQYFQFPSITTKPRITNHPALLRWK